MKVGDEVFVQGTIIQLPDDDRLIVVQFPMCGSLVLDKALVGSWRTPQGRLEIEDDIEEQADDRRTR